LNQKFVFSRLIFDRCVVDPEPFDRGEDIVSGFGPSEGLRVGVVPLDEAGGGIVQSVNASVHGTPDLLIGEQREEPIDLIEP
jgi:hypothetical protein